jgi:protein-L-isoaspartate(D-aspartate) O-methyltransferase
MAKKMGEFDLMMKSIMLNNQAIGKKILDAFRICDRKSFVKDKPYADTPQHISHGQTISQPSTVAKMINDLDLEPGLDVLEIGTNTGYHAALVSWLVHPGSVSTIEIFPDLAEMAKKNVRAFMKKLEKKEAEKFSKIDILAGDALDRKTGIWKKKYDRIYFTAGVDPGKIRDVKEMGKALLKEGGFILYPTRESWDWGALEIWQKKNRELRLVRRETGYAFVPLLRHEDLEEMYRKR